MPIAVTLLAITGHTVPLYGIGKRPAGSVRVSSQLARPLCVKAACSAVDGGACGVSPGRVDVVQGGC